MTREEEIKEVARNRANQYSHPVEWYDCYKHWIEGAEWADQTMIDKACNWLLNNLKNYSTNALGAEYLIEDLKNYMKGE